MKFDWIVNKLKERIYPYTHADAIIMDDEETKLSDKFTDVDEHLADTALHVPVDGNVGQVLTKKENGNAWETIHNEGIEIVDNLTTDDATKALSAAQGKELKSLIDAGGGTSELTFERISNFHTGPNASTINDANISVSANSTSSLLVFIEEGMNKYVSDVRITSSGISSTFVQNYVKGTTVVISGITYDTIFVILRNISASAQTISRTDIYVEIIK